MAEQATTRGRRHTADAQLKMNAAWADPTKRAKRMRNVLLGKVRAYCAVYPFDDRLLDDIARAIVEGRDGVRS